MITYLLISLKDVKTIFKISNYANISTLLFLIFITYNSAVNMCSKKKTNLLLYSNNFGFATGTLSLSFMIHNSIIPIY